MEGTTDSVVNEEGTWTLIWRHGSVRCSTTKKVLLWTLLQSASAKLVHLYADEMLDEIRGPPKQSIEPSVADELAMIARVADRRRQQELEELMKE